MSWLNSSLSTLKGQLTSLAQEVLTEGSQEDASENQVTNECDKKNEELLLLCSAKDNEIIALRKQIVELQAKSNENAAGPSKSALEKHGSLEDSWFWEPENIPSDSSTKIDNEANSESSSGGEMITIPLDTATNESGSYEKLSKNSDERNQRIKKLAQENITLSEKIARLVTENTELNSNLEELDSQHNIAIQNVLDLKNDLQKKYNKIQQDFDDFKKKHEEKIQSYETDNQNLKKELEESKAANLVNQEFIKKLKVQLKLHKGKLEKQQAENQDLKANLQLKENHLLEIIEKVESVEQQDNKEEQLSWKFEEVKKENEYLKEKLEEIENEKEKIEEELKEFNLKRSRDSEEFVKLPEDLEENRDNVELQLSVLKQECLDKIERLAEKIFELKKEEKADNKEILEFKILILENKLSLLETFNDKYLNKIQQLKTANLDPDEHENLIKRNETLVQNISQLNKEYLEFQQLERKRRQDLEEEILNLTEENIKLKGRLQPTWDSMLELKELERKLSLVEAENKSYLQNILDLEKYIEEENKKHLQRIEDLQKISQINPEEYTKCIEKNKDLEQQLKAIEENKKSEYSEKIEQLLFRNFCLEKEVPVFEDRDEEIKRLLMRCDVLEEKVSLLQKDNNNYLERIDNLKMSKTIDPEEYEQLQDNYINAQRSFEGANYEFMEIQQEDNLKRQKLKAKIEGLLKILEQQLSSDLKKSVPAHFYETDSDAEINGQTDQKIKQPKNGGFLELKAENEKLKTELELTKHDLWTTEHDFKTRCDNLEQENTILKKLNKPRSNSDEGDDEKWELQNKCLQLQQQVEILETDLEKYRIRIEELKKSKNIDPEAYEAMKERQQELKYSFQAANDEFEEYQAEQDKIRTNLEDKIQELQNINKELEHQNTAQTDDDQLREDLQEKILWLEKKIEDLTKTNENLMSQLEEFRKSSSNYASEIDRQKIEIDQLKDNIKKCEANASDVESKLMIENVDLQKKLIDLESCSNQNRTENIAPTLSDFISFSNIKQLFSTYIQVDLKSNDIESVKLALESARERIWKIDVLERNLKQMSDEISRLVKDKSGLEHEKETLLADIGHYKSEVNELMESNEILLNELENYKRNKLETIHENNEDGIEFLERQLEDCNNLNKTLEDEYKELNERIENLELEKQELLLQLNTVQNDNEILTNTTKDIKLQLETLECEKCNLIFEINEMKTDDKKSAIESEINVYKNKTQNLELQLERLSKDHADLVAAMQSQQNSILEHTRDAENTAKQLQNILKEKDSNILAKENEICILTKELETITNQLNCNSAIEREKEDLIIKLAQLQYNLQEMEEKMQNLTQENTDLTHRLTELENERQNLETLLKDFKSNTKKDEEIQELNSKIQQLEKSSGNAELLQTIETINNEKNELLRTVTTKHNENMTYYMEIQRLGQLLQAEMEKSTKSQNILSNCESCAKLQAGMTEMVSSHEKLKDQINFLKEKSDIMTTNLLTEQTNQKLLQQEKVELVEQNNNLRKDLERLRQHLVELEEAHTQETLDMQNILDETKAKMAALQEEVSKSSNAYTSASIRATQHAETLQAQYALLSQQRDDLVAKLSSAEDRESKNQAALVNLQCALEQFQKEKEKDILSATHRIRKELQNEQDKQKQLQTEIASLNQQLAEANQGLLAAARLSDQLEISQVTISTLREETYNQSSVNGVSITSVEKLQNKNLILDEKLRITEFGQADKIEKNLIKSLIIGYIVSSNQNDKAQILRMISSVLDFSQTESDKIGLNKNQSGWFGGLLQAGAEGQYSLTSAFVRFLEKESQPRENASGMPNLLNIVAEGSTTTGSTDEERERKVSETRPNQAVVQPILLNESVLEQFAPTRNSSSILKDILNDS